MGSRSRSKSPKKGEKASPKKRSKSRSRSRSKSPKKGKKAAPRKRSRSKSPKKGKKARSKSPKKRTQKKSAAHPPVAEMVVAAVTGLKERKGSSLAAIKKYVGAHYRCDAEKLAPFIRRFVKKAVRDGTLVQKSGTGASGSFR